MKNLISIIRQDRVDNLLKEHGRSMKSEVTLPGNDNKYYLVSELESVLPKNVVTVLLASGPFVVIDELEVFYSEI